MKLFRWLELILLMLLLVACSPRSGPGVSIFGGNSVTATPPVVGVTHAPSAENAMRAFLEDLKKDDFTAMYSLISAATQKDLPPEKFIAKYNDALDNMGASKLDYELLSETLSPSTAQVGFRIVYHTALVGDIQRDMSAHFTLENGQWRLQWDDSLILPELAGGNSLKMDYQIPSRGDIYDRNGLPIVTQSDAYAIGITPGQLTGKSEGVVDAELGIL